MRILLSSHQTPAPNGDVCRAEERPRRESAALKGSDSDGRRVKKRAASGLRFAPALAQGLVTQSHGHDTTSPPLPRAPGGCAADFTRCPVAMAPRPAAISRSPRAPRRATSARTPDDYPSAASRGRRPAGLWSGLRGAGRRTRSCWHPPAAPPQDDAAPPMRHVRARTEIRKSRGLTRAAGGYRERVHVSCAGADVAARGARQLPAAPVREQCALPAVSRASDLCAERDGRGPPPLLVLGEDGDGDRSVLRSDRRGLVSLLSVTA